MSEKELRVIEMLVEEGKIEEALRYDRLVRKRKEKENKDA